MGAQSELDSGSRAHHTMPSCIAQLVWWAQRRGRAPPAASSVSDHSLVRGEPRAYRWEGRCGRCRWGGGAGGETCGACPEIGYVTRGVGLCSSHGDPKEKPAYLAGRLAVLMGGCTAAPGASDAPASVKGELEDLGKARGAGSPPLPSGPWKLAEARGGQAGFFGFQGQTESTGLK